MPLRGEMRVGELSFFKTFSCAKFDVVVVNKTFLGHPKKFKKTQKFPLPFRSNSSELDSIC